MTETKDTPDAVEIFRGAVGRIFDIFDEIIASEEAVLAERQRHAGEVARLREQLDEARHELAARRALAESEGAEAMSETKGALELLEEIGSRGLSDLDFYALHAAILAERQRHAEEVARLEGRVRLLEADNRRLHAWSVTDEGTITSLRDQLRRVEGERDRMQRANETLAVRMDLPASQLLMVGSELCGDGKIDPNDHRDPRWTPSLQQAAKVMRELTARRAHDADVRACAEAIAAPARKMAEELARNYSRFPPVPMSPLEQRAMRLLAADFLKEDDT